MNKLSDAEIREYRTLQKQTEDENKERASMKTELKILAQQGLEKLQKYGFSEYKDIPEFEKMVDSVAAKVRTELEEMKNFCSFMADKKMEKMDIMNKSAEDDEDI
jgi:hypothetical protein